MNFLSKTSISINSYLTLFVRSVYILCTYEKKKIHNCKINTFLAALRI